MRLIVLIVGIAVLLPVSSFGVTLKPGTYKLEWRIPDKDGGLEYSPSGDLVKVDEARFAKVTGLVSDGALSAVIYAYTVFVDESKGSGTGYDLVYAVPNADLEHSVVDLSKAASIRVKRVGNTLVPVDANDSLVDVVLGDKDGQVRKQAALSVDVLMKSDAQGTDVPKHAEIRLRGCWGGTVETDEGHLPIQTADMNGNGRYDDKASDEMPGDAISIRREPPDTRLKEEQPAFVEHEWDVLFAGKACPYRGKLYAIEVSRLGNTVRVDAYKGDTGRLRIAGRDGLAKPGVLKLVDIERDNEIRAIEFFEDAEMEYELPLGEYEDISVMFMVEEENGSGQEEEIVLLIGPGDPVIITKDKTTTIRLGGPIEIAIEPGAELIQIRCGEEKDVGLKLSAGSDKVLGVATGREPEVRIVDASGTTLWTGTSGSGSDGVFRCSVSIPEDWKPGTYKITATLDLSPYQKPVSAEKALKVDE